MIELNNVLDRLRGITRVPITDGLGPVNGGGDSPTEYVRQFEMPPHYPMPGSHLANDTITVIEKQAARIAELEAAINAAIDMIQNCPDVPRDPSSLPMMVLDLLRRTITPTN
jgi:hypothetical protein